MVGGIRQEKHFIYGNVVVNIMQAKCNCSIRQHDPKESFLVEENFEDYVIER